MTPKKSFKPTKSRLDELREGVYVRRDTRDGSVYVCHPDTVLAVQVAMATGRPLLLGGPPGCGKSSLAAFIAREMRWNYFEYVVTSTTRAQDMQWSVDEVRRLRDASAPNVQFHEDLRAYVDPGVLWWAMRPDLAQRRGYTTLPEGVKEAKAAGDLRSVHAPSVVLLDEVDKADPDVPNDVLVALGSQRIQVHGTDLMVEAPEKRPPLVLITTNDERTLSPAFVRRCVVHRLDAPGKDVLVEIARAHFGDLPKNQQTYTILAQKVEAERVEDDPLRCLSTAEYLDAVAACLEFRIKPGGTSDKWKAIETAILRKADHLP
jgi:MoxR-like ATPase